MLEKTTEVCIGKYTLYDDASVKKKLEVMGKWDAMIDDSRNPWDISEFYDTMDNFLEIGGNDNHRIVGRTEDCCRVREASA